MTDNKDNYNARQPQLIKEEQVDYHVDPDEKAVYREWLRQKLQDPGFRQIEGFPIGEDEAILALSDPPYYTACPNPFLPEIITQWQQERARLREELGLPSDEAYHREPFASDVSEGKGNAIYNAHPYHTKVPHRAIMRYLLHYTDPGDIVFDGFCGTGMTGVAAQLCYNRDEVEALGYSVDENGAVHDGQRLLGRLGLRKAVLNDISPAATFISYNYTAPINNVNFQTESKRILYEVRKELGWMFETWHPHCGHPDRVKARINFTVWSEVFICSECGNEIVFWRDAVDKSAGKVRDLISCPTCGTLNGKRDLSRAWETTYDSALRQTVRTVKQVPVFINYSIGKKRFEKSPDEQDYELLERLKSINEAYQFPKIELMRGDKTSDPINVGITHTHHFYTRRNLLTLSRLKDRILNSSVKSIGLFWFTSSSVWCQRTARLQMANYFRGGGGVIVPTLSGTLYVGSVSIETNVLERFRLRARIASALDCPKEADSVAVTTASSTLVNLPDSCIDYIFVDPPFGGNLMYSELSFLWEAWLEVMTNTTEEAVESRSQGKTLVDYQRLIEYCFREFYRVLKPGRWVTIEFHNSQNRVWNAIQEAILRAGFVLADVRTFDKQKGSFNQVTATGSVKQDLIISAYKPYARFEQLFLEEAGTENGTWEFVRQHLTQLPVIVSDNGVIETLSERQDYLLFDRMVAFHIQRGATVPLSAAQFYKGLRKRFVERDGMFFLPEQVPEYDRARLQAQRVAQLSLFVNDEKSSIQWLRQQIAPELGGRPQTYQEIQPKFLKQLHQARHETLPELSEILEQNFLQDEQGRWYIPDPNKATDLERVREKALLREFQEYAKGKKKLKQFRTEAVRAGFAHAWRNKEYVTIVEVAERLPERILQEDPDLLMYYDNASLHT